MDWFSYIQGLGTLAGALLYLFEGLSLGTIPIASAVLRYERDGTKDLTCLIMKGSALFSMLYFLIILIVDMYYGYYDAFILPVSLVALIILTFLLVSLGQHNQSALDRNECLFACFLFQTLLIVKLSHTSYFMVDNTLHYQAPISNVKWRVSLASIILELVQLMPWTLIPFLLFPNSKRYLTLWSLEYADLISHFIVIVTYANGHKTAEWNNVIQTYFVFYIINLVTWVFPLLAVCMFSDNNKMIPPCHAMIVDIITDIPMFITTMVTRAYVQNIYICFDIAIKFIVFARGVIWVPYKVYHDDKPQQNEGQLIYANYPPL
ncbi:unnamed protein product [Adineta steineri]|uniref:Uncharacterized protein n=1 Tax=Adineta steineri TaxID=433720 RepID=A0A815BYC4_9BILA|nr:unnamed protein product [Adineta steineri]CAF1275889.1 unnamed protein product [Adineta steineri]